jgi:hypothetical protein
MLEMKIEELQNLLTEEVNEESSEDKLIDIYQDLMLAFLSLDKCSALVRK